MSCSAIPDGIGLTCRFSLTKGLIGQTLYRHLVQVSTEILHFDYFPRAPQSNRSVWRVKMRALRMLAWILLPLSAVLPIAEAKTPFAYVANHATNTVSVVNTSNN